MPSAPVDAFVELLRRRGLLEAKQIEALDAHVRARCPEPKALAQLLVQKGWLTSYQARHLLAGRAEELILGKYVVLDLLGEGGMGQVFKARHRGLGRVVAIKVIRPDRLASADAGRRFLREIHAASKLAHPNVIAVLDADQVGNVHLMAMEFVEGTDLGKLVKEKGALPVALACECVRQAACGLAHAHEKGMVHRDIKPSNLLLTQAHGSQAGGVVKLMDLGLSRVLTETGSETIDATLTRNGAVVGTPDYMAPEQARDAHGVDIRGDIYSLGCTLYTLLSGRVPFPGGTGMEKVFQHQLEEPEPIEKLCPHVPANLGAVLRKLMSKRPEDRYQTPAETARALEPFCAGLGRTAAQPAKVDDEDALAGDTLRNAGASSRTLRSSSSSGRRAKKLAPGSSQWLPGPRRRRWPALLAGLVLVAAAGVVAWALSNPGGAGDGNGAEQSKPIASGPVRPPTSPGLPADAVALLGDPRWRHWGLIESVAISPDGSRVASGGFDRVVRVWDFQTGKETAVLAGHTSSVTALAFSPDGNLLASGSHDRTVRLWSVATSQELGKPRGHDDAVRALVFSPDGQTLASGSADKSIKLWDVAGRNAPVTLAESGPVHQLVFGSDSQQLVSASRVGNQSWNVRFWNVREKSARQQLQYQGLPGGIFIDCPRGQPVVAIGLPVAGPAPAPPNVKLVDPVTVKERTLPIRGEWSGLALSGDGKTLALGLGGGIRLYDTASGVERSTLSGTLPRPARMLVMSADGKRLASLHGDCAVRVWDTARGLIGEPAPPFQGFPDAVAFTPDGKTIVSTGLQDVRRVRVWDVTTGRNRVIATAPDGNADHVAVVGKGQLAAVWGAAGVNVWEIATGRLRLSVLDDTWSAISPAFAPDGAGMATYHPGEGLSVHHFANDRPPTLLPADKLSVATLSFLGDGKTLAVGLPKNQTVQLWDIDKRALRTSTGAAPGHATSISSSADGKRIAYLGVGPMARSHEVKIWDGGGRPQTVAGGADRLPYAIALSPDGTLVAATGTWGARVTEVASGRTWDLLTTNTPQHVVSPGFSPDGQTLTVAVAPTGHVVVWDTTARHKLADWQLPGQIYRAAYAPDGRSLAIVNGNNTISLFRIPR